MYFFDFLSQYNRFLEGKVPAPDFAHWLFAYNDEMEESLHGDEWEIFAEVQHLAAELTGELISESQFRDLLLELRPMIDQRANLGSRPVVVENETKTIRSFLPITEQVTRPTRSVNGQVLSLAAVGIPTLPEPARPREVEFGARP